MLVKTSASVWELAQRFGLRLLAAALDATPAMPNHYSCKHGAHVGPFGKIALQPQLRPALASSFPFTNFNSLADRPNRAKRWAIGNKPH